MKRFCILVVMLLAAVALIAQDTPAAKDTTPKKDVTAIVKEDAVPTYRFAFSVYELVDGKRTNQRDYSLLVQADGRGPYSKIKIGTKVPIVTSKEPTQYTYTDVGLELECSAVETTNNKLAVRIELNLSSFALSQQNANSNSDGLGPVFRTITQRLRSVLTPGKPQMIASLDDPNSNKRFQVEATATKVE